MEGYPNECSPWSDDYINTLRPLYLMLRPQSWHKGVPMPPLPFRQQTQPEPPTAEAPDISIHEAAAKGNVGKVNQHLAVGTDVNAKDDDGETPLDLAIKYNKTETADLLRKHGGKTGEEL
jgi:hypothetical protein